MIIFAKFSYFIKDFTPYLILLGSSVFIAITGTILAAKNAQRPWANILIGTTVAWFGLIFCFTSAEAYFRYIYEASDGIGFLKVAQKWHSRHVTFNGNFRRDAREFVSSKAAEEIRIGTIGDSVTFGIGIENPQDRYSNLLEEKLRSDGFNAVVYNLGMSGIDTDDEIEDFHRLEPQGLKFDLITWQYFLNDNNTSSASANAQITKKGTQRLAHNPVLKFIVDHSFFADFLYWRLSTTHDQTFKELVAEDLRLYQEPSIIPGHQAQIREFVAELKQKNLPAVVIMFPLIHSETIRDQSRQQYHEMLQVFQEASPAAIIDLDAIYAPYPVDMLRASRFDQHPNELAHRLAAEALYQQVKALISQQIEYNQHDEK